MGMTHKGYTGSVEYDADDRVFHGKVVGITADVITFEGSSVDELEQDFRSAVDDYLEMCAAAGMDPQRSYSGRFVLRLSPALHGEVTAGARRAGCSMNEWITDAIQMRLRAERPASVSEADDRVSHAAGG